LTYVRSNVLLVCMCVFVFSFVVSVKDRFVVRQLLFFCVTVYVRVCWIFVHFCVRLKNSLKY